jgi:hypothetical protein
MERAPVHTEENRTDPLYLRCPCNRRDFAARKTPRGKPLSIHDRGCILRTDAEATKLKRIRFHSLLLPALALCLYNLPATASYLSTLFTDLGPPGDVYQIPGWVVSGSNSGFGETQSVADLFTVAGSGSFTVDEINLAVGYLQSPYTFDASIWTDVSGSPGAPVPGAVWNSLTTSTYVETCCGLVSITGITGVHLTGGTSYFMVLTPVSFTDTSDNPWHLNNQGVTGDTQSSHNTGGLAWFNDGNDTLGAFDILGSTPEPGSLLLFGSGLVGILCAYRRKSNR